MFKFKEGDTVQVGWFYPKAQDIAGMIFNVSDMAVTNLGDLKTGVFQELNVNGYFTGLETCDGRQRWIAEKWLTLVIEDDEGFEFNADEEVFTPRELVRVVVMNGNLYSEF